MHKDTIQIWYNNIEQHIVRLHVCTHIYTCICLSLSLFFFYIYMYKWTAWLASEYGTGSIATVLCSARGDSLAFHATLASRSLLRMCGVIAGTLSNWVICICINEHKNSNYHDFSVGLNCPKCWATNVRIPHLGSPTIRPDRRANELRSFIFFRNPTFLRIQHLVSPTIRPDRRANEVRMGGFFL